MRNLLKAVLFALLLLPSAAFGQCNSTTPLPSNTVLGRMGIGSGPCQAIPFSILLSQISGVPATRNINTTSPLTGGGSLAADLTLSFSTQSANTVLSGPTTGSAAAPAFRALVGADLPAPSASTLGGIESYAAVTHQWINTISTSGVPSSTQPSIADISGWGTGVATALGVNVGSAGAPVLFNGAGGTPSSLTLTNATGLPLAGGGTNNALTASNGGVVYSDASKLNILAGTATSGQCLLSGSSTTPSWGSCASGSTTTLTEPLGRLTLTVNTPVMTATAAAQTTLRYDCYLGNNVPYYNGTSDLLDTISSCEVTDAMVSAASAGQVVASNVYDVWWVHGGTNRICLAMSASTGGGGGWSSDTGGSNTARGTGYSQLDRVTRPYITNKNAIANCFNGATNYGSVSANQGTYLGTVWASANGQISYTFGSTAAGGTAALFGVWNMYNRVVTATAVTDNTSTWTFSSATAAALDGSNNNRISFVTGLAEDGVPANLNYRLALATSNGATGALGMGLDSTSAITTGAGNLFVSVLSTAPPNLQNVSNFPFPAQIGFHFIQALQAGDGTTTSTAVGSGFSGALSATLRN